MRILLALFLLPITLHAQPPAKAKMLTGPAIATGPVVREVWADRYNNQGRLGWVQVLSYEVTENNQPLIRTVMRDHMRYLRSGDPYTEYSEQYSVETKTGDVVEVGYRTSLGKNQDLVIRGRPNGNRITLEVLDHEGKAVVYRQEKAWDPEAKGLYYQEKLLEGKPPTPGQALKVKGFMPILNAVAETTFTLGSRKKKVIHGKEKTVVEVTQSFPKDLYLESSTHYLDAETGETLLSTEDNSLFDLVSHQRTTKEMALASFAGSVKDKDAPVTIDKPIPMGLLGLPRKVRVQVEMSMDDSPEAVFKNNRRQQFIKKEGGRAEFLLASKQVEGVKLDKEEAPGKEYLESNFYIRSDDATVKKIAKEAIREATDPKQQMERITRWVKKQMKGDYEVGFATADEVARTLEGDCTESGILTAAMGRTLGIPTRVCFGLVYDPENKGFGGHLWTEAWHDGSWNTYDATSVLDYMGAAYLRIDGFSMKEVLNPDELGPVRRGFAGRMKVYLLEAK